MVYISRAIAFYIKRTGMYPNISRIQIRGMGLQDLFGRIPNVNLTRIDRPVCSEHADAALNAETSPGRGGGSLSPTQKHMIR